MKKKVLVLLVVALMAAVPAMAASTRGAADDGSVGIGLNLGTNTGLGMKFGMGKFDIFADVGLDVLHISSNGMGLGFDVGISYEVYDADFGGGHHMPITVGAMVPMSFFFGNPFAMNLGVLAQVGLEYQIPDVPVLFYLRVGLGIDMALAPNFNPGVGGAGSIGVLYVF